MFLIFISFFPPILINSFAILGINFKDEYNRPNYRKKTQRKGDGIVGDSWLLVTVGLFFVLACFIDNDIIHIVDRFEGLNKYMGDCALIVTIMAIYFLLWLLSVYVISTNKTPKNGNKTSKITSLIARKRVINTLGVIGLGTFLSISIGGMLP